MRIKLFLPLLMIVFFSSAIQAQKPSRVTIKGTLQDTVHEAIPFATLMLLNPTDSSLVSFTTSNDKGDFTINNVSAKGKYYTDSHVVSFSVKYSFGKIKKSEFVEKSIDENSGRIK